MIQFANDSLDTEVRAMWKTCFGDSGEYIDLYFRTKYKPENTLLYYCDGKPVASLQMLHYSITFYGEKIPFYYMSGLCTLLEYRKKGFMGELIRKSHQVIAERNVALAILVPANEPLSFYYNQFGYENTFLASTEPIYPLKNILEKAPDIETAYKLFNETYCEGDFGIQRTLEDFEAIVADYKLFNSPDKFNLPGMACIINPQYLLELFAAKNKSLNFVLKLNTEYYRIIDGKVFLTDENDCDFTADLRLLARLLFGYKTSSLEGVIPFVFPEHKPVINFMLE